MRQWAVKSEAGFYTYGGMTANDARCHAKNHGAAIAIEVEITEVGSAPAVAKNATPEISQSFDRTSLAFEFSKIITSRVALNNIDMMAGIRAAFALAEEFIRQKGD